jgi:hypothetical protein
VLFIFRRVRATVIACARRQNRKEATSPRLPIFRPSNSNLPLPLVSLVARRASAHLPKALATDDLPETTQKHEKTFTFGGDSKIDIVVHEDIVSGHQHIHLRTTHPSTNLILHWGVQGGQNYRGGWRLPVQRPPNTIQYKDRALQTAWQCALSFSVATAITESLNIFMMQRCLRLTSFTHLLRLLCCPH